MWLNVNVEMTTAMDRDEILAETDVIDSVDGISGRDRKIGGARYERCTIRSQM